MVRVFHRIPFSSLHNPLALRLGNRLGRLLRHTVIFINVSLGLLISVSIYGQPYLPRTPIFSILTGLRLLSFIFLFSAFVFIPFSAASLSLNYYQSMEYTLVSTTSLSNLDLAEGFILGALYRSKVLLGFILGLLPVITSSLYSGTSSLFLYDGVIGQINLGIGGSILKQSLLTLLTGVELLGFILLSCTLSVGLGLSWQMTGLASAVGLLVPFLLTYFTTYFLREGISQWAIQDIFWRDVIQTILLIPAPFLLSFGCVYLIQLWARK